ncbi:MAG: hypothetical protein HRU09_18220 [Oligoflexales bacterium]|nr:hypothetical protein [Oligoflexales bacterium]
MKLVTTTFALAISTISLASPSEWVFKGHGEYRNAAGESSHYSSTVNKSKTDENTCTVVKTIFTEDGETMTWSKKLIKNELGLIEVQNLEGDVIGSGYYFKDHTKKMMHIDFQTPEGSVEKTIVADLDGYKEIGSMTEAATQERSTWREKGERVFPLQ